MHRPNSKASKMANYNKNRQANGGCFDQYINFDQFLMQHNIGNPSPFYGPQERDVNYPSYNNPPTGFNARPQQQQSTVANGNYYPPPTDLLQNSNLLVTAPEFVPQKINNSNLTVNADEFVPNRTKTHNNQAKAELKNSKPSKDDSVIAADNKKQSPRRERERDERIPESVIEKLNDTHIFDEQNGAQSTSLDSSGGAIKKIRNQRNNSRDRHSTGSLFVHNSNCKLFWHENEIMCDICLQAIATIGDIMADMMIDTMIVEAEISVKMNVMAAAAIALQSMIDTTIIEIIKIKTIVIIATK